MTMGHFVRFLVVLFPLFVLSCSGGESNLREIPLKTLSPSTEPEITDEPEITEIKKALPEIQHVQVTPSGESTRLILNGRSPILYTAFRLSDPARLIVDMPDVGLGSFRTPIMINLGPVLSVTPRSNLEGSVSRLEIVLDGEVKTDTHAEGNNLIILVARVIPLSPPDPPIVPVKKVALPAAQKLTDVHFENRDGLSLVVTADGSLFPNVFRIGKNRLVLDFPNVKSLVKAISVSANDKRVKQVRIGKHPDKMRLVIDLLAPTDYSLQQEEGQLRVALYKPGTVVLGGEVKSLPPSPPPVLVKNNPIVKPPVVEKEVPVSPTVEAPLVEKLPPPAVVDVPLPVSEPVKEEIAIPLTLLQVTPTATVTVTEAADPPPAPPDEVKPAPIFVQEVLSKDAPAVASPSVESTILPKYHGKKISLDFQDADIASVIRLIADVSGLNMVLDDDVKGRVTLTLLEIPWDQALDTILKMNGLGQLRDGNIILISSLANITRQQDEEAKAKESLIKAEDLVTKTININYAKASALVEPLKKNLSPRGEMTVEDRTNVVIINDIVRKVEAMTALIKLLDVPTPQVDIEARIVEVRPTFNKSLGIQWGVNKKITSGANQVGLTNGTGVFGVPSPDFAINLPAAPSFGGFGFTFGRLTSNPLNLDLRLSAGEARGDTRIVSSPKISVLDNQSAKISQGSSIPYATTSSTGGTQTTFVDATLALDVTPHISSDGGVIMLVKITKNAPGANTNAGPIILRKEATTQVLVRDGETVVIGGINEITRSESVSGVPGLMNIPIIGWFFKNKAEQEERSELLVFLTPKIIR